MGAAPPHEAFPRGKAAALRALELDESAWDPHVALGYVAHIYEWDWAAAERESTIAMARQPGDSDVYLFHSFMLKAQGRFEEATAALQRAHALDPLSALLMGNRGQERYRDAIAELDDVRRSWPSPKVLGWLGYACACAGEHGRARDLLAALEAMPPDRTARCFEMARIHIGLNELDAALARLEEACEARETEIAAHLAVDPSMDALRPHARFKAILRRVGLPA